jgi:mannitol/fructose-specific phosphotransferase system IIA component (Ntr-type)
MMLADMLSPELVIPDMRAADRWEAIEELIQLLVAHHRIGVEHKESIVSVVKRREASMSTGIGFGIGIPHASTDLISEVTGVFGRSLAGINFDALDDQPVKLVMLFLVPQGQFQRHLHTLAEIAKLLHRAELRQALEAAPSAAAIYETFRRFGG